jgi:AraC-like DNA-binding protein
MLVKIIYLITALLGFLTIALIGLKFNSKKHTNFFLLLFFFLGSLRFLAYSLLDLNPYLPLLKKIDVVFVLFSWPLLYLYFGKLNNIHNNLKSKELFHLVTPLLVTIIYCLKTFATKEANLIGIKIGFIVTVCLNIFYLVASYKLLKQNIWKRNSKIAIINKQNLIINKWTKILFGLFTLMLVRFLINLGLNKQDFWYINQNNYLWIGAIIWIVLYIKILYSPEFLYGYDMFQNKIKEYKKNTIVFDRIWDFKGKEVINIQDVVLKENIETNIQNYIIDIENLALNTNLFLNDKFKINDLINKLNLPKSHVTYLFKYHATISFSDFKKIIRIQKSLTLIEEGFLKNNTLEALAAYTGFSSYSPFFKSFKSITGVSPQEYLKNKISVA